MISECKHLGVVLSKTLCIKRDVDRATDSFLKQFFWKFCKFNYADRNVLVFLFKPHSSSFYAVENWTFGASNKALQRLSIAYHKAVRRISGMTPWESNHDAFLTVEVDIVRYLYAQRRVSFAFALWNSESPFVSLLCFII